MSAAEESDSITILICDDHAIVREGIRSFLESQEGFVIVGEAGNGEAAAEIAAETSPDVVLMDLVMAGGNGVEGTRRVKLASPRSAVVVLTSFHGDEHILPAIRAGAQSYLLKDIAAADLAAAIRRAARGEATLHPRVAKQLLDLTRGTEQASPNPFLVLTERELEILRCIGEAKSNAEIAAQLFISQKTVKGHVSNVLGKLHLADRTEAAVMAWREGLMDRGE